MVFIFADGAKIGAVNDALPRDADWQIITRTLIRPLFQMVFEYH